MVSLKLEFVYDYDSSNITLAKIQTDHELSEAEIISTIRDKGFEVHGKIHGWVNAIDIIIYTAPVRKMSPGLKISLLNL